MSIIRDKIVIANGSFSVVGVHMTIKNLELETLIILCALRDKKKPLVYNANHA